MREAGEQLRENYDEKVKDIEKCFNQSKVKEKARSMSRRLISSEVALEAYCNNNNNEEINGIKSLMKSMNKIKKNKSIKIKWRNDIPVFIPKDELTLFNK